MKNFKFSDGKVLPSFACWNLRPTLVVPPACGWFMVQVWFEPLLNMSGWRILVRLWLAWSKCLRPLLLDLSNSKSFKLSVLCGGLFVF